MLRRKCLQLARQGFQAAKKTEASAAALSDQVRATSQSAREGRKALKLVCYLCNYVQVLMDPS